MDVQQQTGGAETTTHTHRGMGVNTHIHGETGARQYQVSCNTHMSSCDFFKIKAQILSTMAVVLKVVYRGLLRGSLTNKGDHVFAL